MCVPARRVIGASSGDKLASPGRPAKLVPRNGPQYPPDGLTEAIGRLRARQCALTLAKRLAYPPDGYRDAKRATQPGGHFGRVAPPSKR